MGPSPNAELVYRYLAEWSRGDFEAALANTDPEAEWHLSFRIPDLPAEKTVFRGRDEVRELWIAFASVWESLTIQMEEMLHEEGDLLAFRARFRGRGKVSGVEVDRVLFYVCELRDGMLLRIRPFEDEESALLAAGVHDGT